MVESEAKQLSEEIMLGAVMFGWKAFQPVIKGIIELAEQAAKDAWDVPVVDPKIKALNDAIKAKYEAQRRRSLQRESQTDPSGKSRRDP